MLERTLEEELEYHERRLKEEKETFEAVNTQVDQYLCDLGITKEQINILLNSQDKFTEENWKKIKELKSNLDQKESSSLGAIKDIRKSKSSQSTLKEVERHWLFVR